MARIDIKGDIVVNEYRELYDVFGWECITPSMVNETLENKAADEPVDVYINSGGGHVMAGQEIYSALRACKDVHIHIEGMACSAASMIACAGLSEISPVGMLMIHNASGFAEGDVHAMEKAKNELKQMNEAIAQAYADKTGKPVEDWVKLMDKETWLTANQCIEYGLVDEIQPQAMPQQMTASMGIRMTPEKMEEAKAKIKERKDREAKKRELVDDLYMFGI